MSSKRHHIDEAAGGAGVRILVSPSARRPSTRGAYLRPEDTDGTAPEGSTWQPTPTTVDDPESDAGSDLTARTRKKAEPVKSACVQCQRRKTKCSGQRPVCRFCSDRNLECSWDIGDGLTRTADLKRKLVAANGRSDNLGELVDAMRSGSDQTSSMLLARLRIGDSLEALLSNIRLDGPRGESRQSQQDMRMTEGGDNSSRPVGTDYPSPTSVEPQLDWPGLGPQYQQLQSYESWINSPGLDPERRNTRQPFFTTPDFDQSRMTWPRNDSQYSTEENIGFDSSIQGFNDAQSKDASAPTGITMVPRNIPNALPTQNTARARRRRSGT